MLKCPFHLPYLTELHTEFPDATIVWTHRDPVECIASACSLYHTLMKLTADTWTIDTTALGQAVMDYTADALEKADQSIEKAKKTMKIIHVRYADNVKNPKEICRKVFENVRSVLQYYPYISLRQDYHFLKNMNKRSMHILQKMPPRERK